MPSCLADVDKEEVMLHDGGWMLLTRDSTDMMMMNDE